MDEIDYEAISLEFAARGWLWQTTEQVSFVPTQKDIKAAVDKMRDKINFEADDGSNYQINMGRLILQRVDGFYDLYVYAGSLNG